MFVSVLRLLLLPLAAAQQLGIAVQHSGTGGAAAIPRNAACSKDSVAACADAGIAVAPCGGHDPVEESALGPGAVMQGGATFRVVIFAFPPCDGSGNGTTVAVRAMPSATELLPPTPLSAGFPAAPGSACDAAELSFPFTAPDRLPSAGVVTVQVVLQSPSTGLHHACADTSFVPRATQAPPPATEAAAGDGDEGEEGSDDDIIAGMVVGAVLLLASSAMALYFFVDSVNARQEAEEAAEAQAAAVQARAAASVGHSRRPSVYAPRGPSSRSGSRQSGVGKRGSFRGEQQAHGYVSQAGQNWIGAGGGGVGGGGGRSGGGGKAKSIVVSTEPGEHACGICGKTYAGRPDLVQHANLRHHGMGVPEE